MGRGGIPSFLEKFLRKRPLHPLNRMRGRPPDIMTDPEMNQRARWIHSVVDEYEGQLLRYAVRLVGDVERARDVVQDTFLKLCREDRRKIEGHLAQWLFTVCRHRAVDVQRKEKRMRPLSPQETADAQSGEKSQTLVAEEHDDADRVQQALARLTDNQQEVVRLKFQNGLSYREIAKITRLSVSNVGYLIHTAVGKIRTELQV